MRRKDTFGCGTLLSGEFNGVFWGLSTLTPNAFSPPLLSHKDKFCFFDLGGMSKFPCLKRSRVGSGSRNQGSGPPCRAATKKTRRISRGSNKVRLFPCCIGSECFICFVHCLFAVLSGLRCKNIPEASRLSIGSITVSESRTNPIRVCVLITHAHTTTSVSPCDLFLEI